MASLDGRYPYVYPRDLSSVCSLLEKLVKQKIKKKRCQEHLDNYARFIYNCQRKDGYLGQRYDGDCKEKSIYKQEDNMAHFINVVSAQMLASGEVNKDYIHAIKKAIHLVLDKYYRDEINLFFSTTSVHESAICGGYDIWTNYAYHKAIKNIAELEKEFDVDILEKRRENILKGTSAEHIFYFEDRYMRSRKSEGGPDLRLDFICLSPFYFDIDKTSDRMVRTAKVLKEGLWDPVLGGLLRYQPYTEDFEMHLHAGSGPWFQYTAVLAQVFYYNDMKTEGDEILGVINKYRQDGELIPEHISTKERFTEFMNLEWETRLDFEKEFDKSIMLPEVNFDLILEELDHMKNAYNRIRDTIDKSPHIQHIVFGCPLIWSHSEYCKALLYRDIRNI